MSAEAVVRWWVARYSRSVPEPARSDRRSELESDLWEHRAARGTGAAILVRSLRGVPADLAWRRSVRARAGLTPARAARGAGWSVAGLSFALLVLLTATAATQDARFAVPLALLVAGAVTLLRRARLGAASVVLGAGAGVALVPCLLPMTGPAALSVSVACVALARARA